MEKATKPKLSDVIMEIFRANPLSPLKTDFVVEKVKEKYGDEWTVDSISRELRRMREIGMLSGDGREGYRIGVSKRQKRIDEVLRIKAVKEGS